MMETKELYKQKYEAQLHEWSAKVEVVKAKAEKASAQAKIDMKVHLDALQLKVEAAKAKLHDIANATDDKWEELKKGAENTWSELKAAIEGTYKAMKPKNGAQHP